MRECNGVTTRRRCSSPVVVETATQIDIFVNSRRRRPVTVLAINFAGARGYRALSRRTRPHVSHLWFSTSRTVLRHYRAHYCVHVRRVSMSRTTNMTTRRHPSTRTCTRHRCNYAATDNNVSVWQECDFWSRDASSEPRACTSVPSNSIFEHSPENVGWNISLFVFVPRFPWPVPRRVRTAQTIVSSKYIPTS